MNTYNPNDIDELLDYADDIDEPIVYLVPSRGRPGNAAELLAAWDATLSDVPAAAVVLVLDDDDPTLDEYLDRLELPAWADVLVGPRLRLGGTLNTLAPIYAAERTGVGFMGDDHRPRTVGWDEQLLAAHHGTPFGVVYGNDLVRGADLPTAVSVDARIIRDLGYMVPPGAVHLYLDDYWRTLGADLGTLVYDPSIVIEHLHPSAGTAELDDGYVEVNRPEQYAADEAVYRSHLAGRHPADIRRLRDLLDEARP